MSERAAASLAAGRTGATGGAQPPAVLSTWHTLLRAPGSTEERKRTQGWLGALVKMVRIERLPMERVGAGLCAEMQECRHRSIERGPGWVEGGSESLGAVS